MSTLRDIGESISKKVVKSEHKCPIVFKIDGKYYEKIKGKEISKDEAGQRTVIAFESK